MSNLAPIHNLSQLFLHRRGSAKAQRLPVSDGRLSPTPRLTQRLRQRAGFWATSLYLVIGLSDPILAQSSNPDIPVICDVNLALLKSISQGEDFNNDLSKNPNIVTADTVSPAGTTTPSLWWINEQFPAKLVTNWIANRDQKQIHLLVNTQYWSGLDYLDRYGTIDRFGRVAQSYGYNLTICNGQKIALARYNCDLLSANPNSCEIWLNANGQNGLGVQSK
jgi:hypothetical protein